MTTPLDALEMRAPQAPAPARASDADVLFPALPPDLDGLEGLNEFAKQITARDAKARLRGTAILVLRQQGYNRREIGRMVGMTPNAVRVALWRARQSGRLNELRGILEHDSLALAIESLNFHLKKKDKDCTIETLKGLGQFKSYNNSKVDGTPGFTMPALTVTIVNAPNQGGQQAIVSDPIGSPRADVPVG